MDTAETIFPLIDKFPVMQDELHLLQETERSVPELYHLSIKRYRKQLHWNIEDTGKVVYQPSSTNKKDGTLELIFCISGNMYCHVKNAMCDQCKMNATPHCAEKTESVDVISCTFTKRYLSAFLPNTSDGESKKLFSDNVLSFSHSDYFVKTVSVCGKSRLTLDALLQNPYSGTFEQLYLGAQIKLLLLNSLECFIDENEPHVFTCKFLSNEADREKITRARDLLLEHISNPITIKALSRKVAMNECYLKKGFKEIYGSTIFEFYQSKRMDHAKYLLYEKGLSVTEVAMLLGYSSISHFSTAFKKHTGLKPCELLFRG